MRRSHLGRRSIACAPLLALLGACAGPGEEIHAAPFFARHATAHGTVETEALGGFLHAVHDAETGVPLARAARPFYGWRNLGAGDWHADLLAPLGLASRRDGELFSYVVPFYLYRNGAKLDGTRESRLVALPGILMRNNSARGLRVGWFPFFGRLERFLTYEDVTFVLWPLYVSAEASGRKSKHFVWPLVGWTTGGGERSWHVWPLVSHATREGRYDRWAVLWPFFQYHRNHLGGGGEEPETLIWLWPPYGRTERGTYVAHTVLWPLFGYASDPRGDFRAFDALTPLIRFQSGGENTGGVVRRRVWPFFGYLEADRMTYRTYLWPIVHSRQEDYVDSERRSFFVLPFWQSWDRTERATGRRTAWRKLWPLYQWEREDTVVRGSFPSLDPFWKNHLITYHYGWLWRLWAWERDQEGDLSRGRAWLDLYRAENGGGEQRRSLSFLWSGRKYVDGAGRTTRETSLLCGLLRWRRTEGAGFAMLSPAFPGPGWPLERSGGAAEDRE